MKKLYAFISALVAGILAAGFIGMAANFSDTWTVPTRRDYIHNEREWIAKMSVNHNAFVTHYNAMRTSVTTGYIPLPLANWREVDSSGDVSTLANHGGILASNSTPILSGITDATNKAQRITWAASNSDPIMFQVPMPPDFIYTNGLTFKSRIAGDGTTDTLSFTVSGYFNEGGTTADATTDGVLSTSYSSYDVTFALSDMTTDTETVTIILTPAAHTTNIMYMTAAWLEYTRNF